MEGVAWEALLCLRGWSPPQRRAELPHTGCARPSVSSLQYPEARPTRRCRLLIRVSIPLQGADQAEFQ
jgi:hypothetical protein